MASLLHPATLPASYLLRRRWLFYAPIHFAAPVETLALSRLAIHENSGHIVSRFGGDVFTLTINNLSHIGDSSRFLEKVLADIREPILFGGHEVFITGSIGVSLFPLESEDATLLVNGSALCESVSGYPCDALKGPVVTDQICSLNPGSALL